MIAFKHKYLSFISPSINIYVYIYIYIYIYLAIGYPEIVVNNQIDNFVFGRDQSVKKNLERGLPFVSTYHPKVKDLD